MSKGMGMCQGMGMSRGGHSHPLQHGKSGTIHTHGYGIQCDTVAKQAGGMHLTGMLSCLLIFGSFTVVDRFCGRQRSDLDRWHDSRERMDRSRHDA